MKSARLFELFLCVTLSLAFYGCGGSDSDPDMDGGTDAGMDAGDSGTPFVPPSFGEWVQYEPEGAACANGSQYKFFVNFSETSENIVIFFAGGGACWDYPSCTGNGARSASNKEGLPDGYADEVANIMGLAIKAGQIYPLMNDDPTVSPAADWNKVFMPYCTGDVFSGSKVNMYEDPDGLEDDLEFHHVGHTNVLKTIDMLNVFFDRVPKMLVSGCSAGGAGAINNYYFLRTGIEGVEKGYLLDDSGPIFPDKEPTSRSLPLHNEVRTVWDADALIASAPAGSVATLMADFGQLSTVLAAEFPSDRLAAAYFQLDYNYSLYSYERFYDNDLEDDFEGLDEHNPADRPTIHQYWADDTALLRAQYDADDNLGYYLPFYRDTNSSHCTTIPGFDDLPEGLDLVTTFLSDFKTLAWAGTEIEAESMNLRDYVDLLLDDSAPMPSFFEAQSEGHYLACSPSEYDAELDLCKEAVCERHNEERKITYECPVPE